MRHRNTVSAITLIVLVPVLIVPIFCGSFLLGPIGLLLGGGFLLLLCLSAVVSGIRPR
jgi:hypothetical protein